MAKLSENQVFNRLNKELNKSLYGKSKDNVYGIDNINLEFVESFGAQEKDSVYIFKNNNQIIFSPGYDNCVPILGYFNDIQDNFKYQELPEQIQSFLFNYAIEIEKLQYDDSSNNIDIIYGSTVYNDTIIPTRDELISTWVDVNIPDSSKINWSQGHGYYSEYEKYKTTHEDYSYNKYFWFRDYQNEYINAKPNDRSASATTETKKSQTGTGQANQKLTWSPTSATNDNNLNIDNFVVYVNSSKWTKVTTFGTTSSKNEYIISQNSSGTITVLFGDGVTSNKPPKSKKIELKYKYSRLEFYGLSNTPNENIKCITGCTSVAYAIVIAYWGKYGVPVYRNGVKQPNKKYKVGSKSINKLQGISGKKTFTYNNKTTTRYYFLELPALSEISSFDYNNLANSGYVKWYSGSTKQYDVDENHEDIVNSVMTATKKAQRKAIGTLIRYISHGIQTTFTPFYGSAYVTDGVNLLSKYIPFAGNSYANGHYAIYQELKTFYTDTSDKSVFLRGSPLFTTNVTDNGTTSQYYLNVVELCLYKELSKGIPVPFGVSGWSSTGSDAGHTIVCCGYKSHGIYGLWNFNFGWYGQFNNNWFTLRINDPDHPNQINPGPDKYLFNDTRSCMFRFYPNEYYNDFIDVTKNNVVFPKTGGKDTILVCSMEYNESTKTCIRTSASTWSYDNTNIPSWLTITKDSTTGVKLILNANANTGSQKTHTFKVFKTKDTAIWENVTVTLESSDGTVEYTLNISETNLIFDSNGYNTQDYIISITSNIGWEIYSTTIPSWITKCQASTNQLALRIAENTTQNILTTTINIRTTDPEHTKTGIINIKVNKAEEHYLTLESYYYNFDIYGGTFYINVDSNIDWKIEYTKPEWLTATKDSNLNRIKLVAIDSTYSDTQICNINVKPTNTSYQTLAKTLQITLSSNIILNVDKNSITFNNHTALSNKIINVTSNLDWNIGTCEPAITTDSLLYNGIIKNGNNLSITAQPNTTTTRYTYVLEIYIGTANNKLKQEFITILILDKTDTLNEPYLKLSTNKLILNTLNNNKTVKIFSNSEYNIEYNNYNWLNITTNTTNNTLYIRTNYEESYEQTCNVIVNANNGLTETLILNIQGLKTDPIPEIDNVGELDENGNIIINRNGQNIDISIYGKNNNDIITDNNLLTLTWTGDIENIQEQYNQDYYHCIIGANLSQNNKIFTFQGYYTYDTHNSVPSKLLSFIQKPQVFTIHFLFNDDRTVFSYDVSTLAETTTDINLCKLNYWIQTTNGTHYYGSNYNINLTISNPLPQSGYNPIEIWNVNNDVTTEYGGSNVTTFKIGDNPDNIERMKILTISYADISKTLIIKQLNSNQIQLNPFDFFTIEYYIDNDNDNYTSLNNFTNTNQLSSINVYSGEGLELIAKLSAKTETGEDKVINKEINNIIYDLSKLKIGYKQDVDGNNTLYKNYLRYSGQHNYDNENESMLINLFSIIQDLDEEIQEINIDFYGHWTNTRSKGRIKTKINTYKQEPSNIDLYQYRYSVSNAQVQRKENTNYVYDLGNLIEDDLTYYTHILRLNYNVKTKAGIIYNLNEYGNIEFSNNNLIKNVFVFASGYNNYPVISNYLYKETNYEYFMTIYLSPTTSVTQIYLNNFIYQTYDKINNVLNPYQSLLLTNSNLTINNNGGLVCSLQPSSGPYSYLEIGAISITGTYNIELTITVNSQNNKLILKVIVENDEVIRSGDIQDSN